MNIGISKKESFKRYLAGYSQNGGDFSTAFSQLSRQSVTGGSLRVLGTVIIWPCLSLGIELYIHSDQGV